MRRKDGNPNSPRGVEYVCGYCGKSFGNREVNCKRHMQEVHGTKDPVPVILVDGQGRQRRLLPQITEVEGV